MSCCRSHDTKTMRLPFVFPSNFRRRSPLSHSRRSTPPSPRRGTPCGCPSPPAPSLTLPPSPRRGTPCGCPSPPAPSLTPPAIPVRAPLVGAQASTPSPNAPFSLQPILAYPQTCKQLLVHVLFLRGFCPSSCPLNSSATIRNPYSESSGTRQYHQQFWKRTVTQQKKSGNKWSLLLVLIIIAALALLFFAFSEMNLLPIDSDQTQSEQFTPPPPPDSPPSDSPSGQSVPTPPDGPPGSSDLPTPPSNPPSSPPD